MLILSASNIDHWKEAKKEKEWGECKDAIDENNRRLKWKEKLQLI